MSEIPSTEPVIKQDSTTPAPTGTSDNPLDAPPAPLAEPTLAKEDEEMGDAPSAPQDKDQPGKDGEGAAAGAEGAAQEAKSKESIENAAREHLISQTHAIVLPSYSTWFDMNDINNIERTDLKPYCLLLETKDKRVFFSLKSDEELYGWQDDIYSRSPLMGVSNPTNFVHKVHVGFDPVSGAFTVRRHDLFAGPIANT